MDKRADEANDGLDLERYAEVVAHLLHFGRAHHAELLERLNVDPAAWSRASREHPEAMARASGDGRTELVARFVEALGAARRRLEQERPLLADIDRRAPEIADMAAPEPLAFSVAPPIAPPEPGARVQLTETLPLDNDVHALAAAAVAVAKPRTPVGPAPSTGTLPLDNDISALAAAVTAPAPHWISMEKHAALCAEIDLDPTQAQRVLQRQGLNAQAKDQIDAQWRSRFAAQPSLWTSWQKVYQEKLARLRDGR